MPKLEESMELRTAGPDSLLPVTAIVAARNEARNLPRCLNPFAASPRSMSSTRRVPTKRSRLPRLTARMLFSFTTEEAGPRSDSGRSSLCRLPYDWIFIVDADEALTPELAAEIRTAVQDSDYDAYYVALRMFFLGRELKHSGASFYKLSLFRRGKGGYECRLKDQDSSMADMEVHEHVVLESDATARGSGKARKLNIPLLHHNVESLSHYIRKHDEYSNWDARVWLEGKGNTQDLSAFVFRLAGSA